MIEAESAFGSLPHPRERCRVSVAIPARDESASIVAALEAFAGQRSIDGSPLDPELFEVVVFANDCSDDTAARVRAFAAERARFALHVVEAALPPAARHIGFARRAVMNDAARRVAHQGVHGIVASTDADSRVSPEWIARTVNELRVVAGVGGRVLPELPPGECAAGVAHAYALEHRYQYALVRLETLLDPRAHDPWPRHLNHQGASFALRARAYIQVGGTPAVPVLEDFALYDALMRADLPFRHSLRVRVLTSGRRAGRVVGGFASHLHAIDEHIAGRSVLLVENPGETLALLRGRGALRRGDTTSAARHYGLARDAVNRYLREAATLGAALETVEREARQSGALRGYARVPIELGIRTLENYRSAPASAARPTRIRAWSGAG